MTRNEVLHKVIEIINEYKSYDSPEIKENSRLAEELGMDSLEIAESACRIERELNISFDADYFDIASVKDFVDLACKKLKIPTNDVQKNVEKTVIKPAQPQNPVKGAEPSKLAGKPVRLNIYKIVVGKLAGTKQTKR